MGSGFFISKEGHVLTTGLLQDADRIWVEHRNSYFLAQKVGHDPLCNLSLLKISEKPKDFTFISFSSVKGDSSVGAILIGVTCALDFKIARLTALCKAMSFLWEEAFPNQNDQVQHAIGPGGDRGSGLRLERKVCWYHIRGIARPTVFLSSSKPV